MNKIQSLFALALLTVSPVQGEGHQLPYLQK